MASHDHSDPSTAEENTNQVASDIRIEALKVRKDILWGLYEEHRGHARHTETLRSTVIGMLIVASAALVTLATYDKAVNFWDVPAALLLIGFGLLGAFFSLYHSEKIWKHKTRAREYWNELDESVVVPIKGRQLKDIRARAGNSFPAFSEGPPNKFVDRVVRRVEHTGFPSSLYLWTVLPLFISLIGLFLLGLMLLDWLLKGCQ